MRRPRCALAVAVVLAVLGVAGTAGSAATGPPASATDPATADATGATEANARRAFVEAEIEAAKSGALYLVLDPRAQQLNLKCEGVLLHRFALTGARFAPPPRSAGPARWPAIAFTLATGLAEPERPEIVPPKPDAADAPAPAKPEPTTPTGGIDFAARQREEILRRAPSRYLLTFSPGLEVSVVGVAGTAADASPGLAPRLAEGWRRLRRWFAGPTLPPRVTLEIPEDEARRLFLDLQPDLRLLVAAP